jgi:hypothetical protein
MLWGLVITNFNKISHADSCIVVHTTLYVFHAFKLKLKTTYLALESAFKIFLTRNAHCMIHQIDASLHPMDLRGSRIHRHIEFYLKKNSKCFGHIMQT